MREIYLDNAATTAVIDCAMAAAEKAMQICYGNAGSVHGKGRDASALLSECRKTVADTLKVDPSCITFTSGGTESINTALRGGAFKNKHLGKHIITTAVEHDATLNTLRSLEQEGFELTIVSPEKDGSVSLDKLVSAIREDTILMSVMGVCNETGAILPYAEAAAELKRRNSKALFHLDLASLNHIPNDMIDSILHDLNHVQSYDLIMYNAPNKRYTSHHEQMSQSQHLFFP